MFIVLSFPSDLNLSVGSFVNPLKISIDEIQNEVW